MPERVQLSRAKGWRMPPNTVNVARPTLWGNPFYESPWRTREDCIALFKDSIRGVWNPATSEHIAKRAPAWTGYDEHLGWLRLMRERRGCLPQEAVAELRGKNLACWCRLGEPCHADVLLKLANEGLPNVKVSSGVLDAEKCAAGSPSAAP